MNTQKSQPIVVKKYANRRLYDTETSSYITLEDMCKYVKAGKDFVVVDAKTEQDLTRQVLTQIILEREINGSSLLPAEFLRSVIRFYDDKMQNVLQQYLNASMQTFIKNQDQVREQFRSAVTASTRAAASAAQSASSASSPFSQFEEMTKNNVAFMEKAFGMFSPFGNGYFAGGKEQGESRQEERPAATARRKR